MREPQDRGGPGQTNAGAARCTRGYAIGEIGPGPAPSDSTRWSSAGGRAGRRLCVRLPSGASPPFRRGCHPPPAPWVEVPTGTTSRRRTSARTDRIRSHRALMGARPTGDPDRRGALLATAVSRPSLSVHVVAAARLALIACIEVRAIGSVYGGMERCRSPEIAMDPDAGAGLVTAEAARARAGEPVARSNRRTWRAAETLWVRIRWPRSPMGTLRGDRNRIKARVYAGVCTTRPRRRFAAQWSHSGTVTTRRQSVLPILVQSGIVAP